MFSDILIPVHFEGPFDNDFSTFLAGLFHAFVTILMVFFISWAVHTGWNAAG